MIAKLQNEIDDATEEFAAVSAGSGLRAMVVSRISRLNEHLASIRSQILMADNAGQNVLLEYWRLVATSSGISFIPECLANGAAMLPSCWEVNTPPASASRLSLEMLDKNRMEFRG